MAEITINSLGEAFKRSGEGFEELGAGCVNVGHVAKQVLTPKQYAVWSTFKGDEAKALDKYVGAMSQHEFLRQAWSGMSLPVFDFYKRVTDLQVMNDGRFRVWGRKTGLTFKAPEYIWLVTEFMGFVDDEDFWSRLNAVAKRPYSISVMHESPHLAKSHKVGVNGVLPDFSNANDDNAIYGEHHGRMERQVEFRTNIAGISKDRHAFHYLREEIDKMREITEPFWNSAGVGVL